MKSINNRSHILVPRSPLLDTKLRFEATLYVSGFMNEWHFVRRWKNLEPPILPSEPTNVQFYKPCSLTVLITLTILVLLSILKLIILPNLILSHWPSYNLTLLFIADSFLSLRSLSVFFFFFFPSFFSCPVVSLWHCCGWRPNTQWQFFST